MAAVEQQGNVRTGGRPAADPRLTLVLRTEWTMLAVRYLAVLALAVLYAALPWPLDSGLVPVLGLYLIAHNLYAHWVLTTRRYGMFFSSVNFAAYLGEITLLVALGGPSASPLFVLYLLFIIAFNTYSRLFRGALLVTLLCCFSYGLVLYGEWAFIDVQAPAGFIAVKMLTIAMGGWLVGALNEFLKETEVALESRASALAASEATLRMILDSADEPILTHDANEFITDANDKACAFLGVSRAQLLGTRIRAHIFDDGNLGGLFDSLRERGEYHGEVMAVRADGEECNVRMHVHSFLQDDHVFYVSIWHDLTEMKNLQEATRRTNLQLEQVHQELYHVNQLKTAFFSGISRRLHSPLSAMLGFIDLLLAEEQGPLNARQRQSLTSCRHSAERILDLVDEVFDLEARDTPDKENAQVHASTTRTPPPV